MDRNTIRVGALFLGLAVLSGACAETRFPAVNMARPPSLPAVPALSEPEAAKVQSLESLPASIEIVRALGALFLNGKRLALDADRGGQTGQMLGRYGDQIVVSAFLKRDGGGVLPIYAMPRVGAQSRTEVAQGERRKHDITLTGTVSQLLPYAPVVNADFLVVLSLETSPFLGDEDRTPDAFAQYEAELAAYRAALTDLGAKREQEVQASTNVFEEARRQFLLDGGEPDDPALKAGEAGLQRNLEDWQKFGEALAQKLSEIPDVAGMRASWLADAKSRTAGRTTAKMGFRVVDLSSQTLWGFGRITSSGDDEAMAMTKATASLLDTLFATAQEGEEGGVTGEERTNPYGDRPREERQRRKQKKGN